VALLTCISVASLELNVRGRLTVTIDTDIGSLKKPLPAFRTQKKLHVSSFQGKMISVRQS
jgi:hypothetical protein